MTRKNDLVWRGMTAATILLAVVLLFSHTYNDIVITTRQGMNLWDILLSGNFLDFYEINVTVSGNPYFPVEQGCAYNILVYIIFAIWNIPLVLLEKLADVDVMNNMFCLAYSKLMIVTGILISARIVAQILKLLDVQEKNRKLFVYLYLTSTLMISVGLITSQYDIISVIFQLLGLKAYLEKKDKWFILWFGIAVCFKYFALMMFIPLLVLRYKKLLSWLISVALVCVPTILTKLPFMHSSGASDGSALAMDLFGQLMEYSRSELNVFVIVYILLVVWCFFQNDRDEEKMYQHKAIWVVFVSYAAFFGLLSVHPYWSILLAPYIVMVIALAGENLYINLLMETCGMAALVWGNMILYYWCYFEDTMGSMLMAGFYGQVPEEGGQIISMLDTMWELRLFPVFNSVFIACMAVIAYLSYPKATARNRELTFGWDGCMDVIVLRWIATTVICLLPILSLFV